MSKPSVWQALLGKPSQSYHYVSSKQDMLHIAASPTNHSSSIQSDRRLETADRFRHDVGDNDSNDDEFKSVARTVLKLTEMYEEEDRGNMPDSENDNNIEDEDDYDDDDDDDVFYTPNTSPRLSLVSNRSNGSSAFGGGGGRRTPVTSRPPSQRSSVPTRAVLPNGNVGSSSSSNDLPTVSTLLMNRRSRRTLTRTTATKPAETVKDETRIHGDISPNASTTTTTTINSTNPSTRERYQFQQSRNEDPITMSSYSNKGHTTASSSLSTSSLAPHSLLGSSMPNSTKFLPSSPLRYENGIRDTDSAASSGRGKQRTTAHINEDHHESLTNGHITATNLNPSNSSAKRKPLPQNFSNGNASYVPSRKQNNVLKTMSKTNPSLMMNMSTLLEVDEDGTRGPNLRTFTNGSQPPSNVVLMQPDNSKHDNATRSPSRRNSTTSTSRSIMSQSFDSRINGGDSNNKFQHLRVPNLRHRRSRSHEDLRSSSRSESRSRVMSTSSVLSSLPVPSGDLPSHGTPGYTSLVLPRAPPRVSLNPRVQVPKIEPTIDGKIDLTRSGIAQTTMATVEVVQGLGASSRGKGLLGVLGKGVSLGRRKTFSGRTGPDASTSGNVHRPLGFTSYRKPPDFVSSSSALVQVWAVGVDGIDARLVGLRLGSGQRGDRSMTSQGTNVKGRSASLRWKFVRAVVTADQEQQQQPQVGYIPGRSFVGRVLECGWEVGDDAARKGDWVIGLLDIRKAGALAEFIVVDKRRIYRVPHPKMPEMSAKAFGKQPERRDSINRVPVWGLTLEELALLPLCGVPAYRAVRTFVYAFSASTAKEEGGLTAGSARIMSSPSNNQSIDSETGRRRRALVLRGHDGIGAMAARMLITKGWDVSIHVPCSFPTESDEAEVYMSTIEERARAWGCDEVIFDDGLEQDGDEGRGAIVRVLERLWSEGDVIDAVLDTVGGKEIWDVAEKFLKSPNSEANLSKSSNGSARSKKSNKGVAQFTTLVGDSPSRVVPSAGDLFKAGVRSLRMGGKPSAGGSPNKLDESPKSTGRSNGKRVAYAWVSTAQDIDWEGQDVSESIAAVLRLALEGTAKPWVDTENRVVPFDKTSDIFVDDGPLSHGSTMVVKIVS